MIVRTLLRRTLPAVLLVAAACGCRQDLNTIYGRRAGLGHSSVNGTAVLGEMFEARGHDVSSRTWLSPSIRRRADCIVWFPDDFQAPRQEVVDWLHQWLYESPGRTLIYVGRDFDAAPDYWERVEPLVPESDRPKVGVERTAAALASQARREALRDGESCEWFTVDARGAARRIRDVDGAEYWTSGWDPRKAELQVQARLVPSDYFAVELASQGDAVLSRSGYENGSQIILVNNGSFLLNLPLVNAEHRQLADALIALIGEDRNVVFLESGAGGPPLKEHESQSPPGLLNLFTVPPFDGIFLHLAVVGGVAALCLWPVFGPPASGGAPRLADFGRHVEALGALLQRTGDRPFAERAVEGFLSQQKERRLPTRRGRTAR